MAVGGLLLTTLPAGGTSYPPNPTAPEWDAEPLRAVRSRWLSDRLVELAFENHRVDPPLGKTRVRVLVPEDWDTSGKRYPVVYLLHGAGDDATAWTEKQDGYPVTLEEFTEGKDVIVVMPDGGGSGSPPGWYSDWYNGGDFGPPEWETYHVVQLVRFVDRNFPTRAERDGRVVAGLSMGGFGAMSYAARNEGLFVAAGSFSGAVDIQAGEVVVPAALSVLYSPCIWGHPVWQRDNWSAHNPTALAPRLRGVSLFVASGNGLPGRHDETPPRPPESMAFEAVIYRMSQNFVEALERAEVPVTTWFYGNGTHGWQDPYSNQRYIYDDLAQFLPQAMAALGPAEPGE